MPATAGPVRARLDAVFRARRSGTTQLLCHRLALAAVLAAVLAAICLATLVGPVWAVDPSPVPSPVLIDPLDPRAGAGASLVGSPLLAALIVLGLGVLAAGATLAYVRLTARR